MLQWTRTLMPSSSPVGTPAMAEASLTPVGSFQCHVCRANGDPHRLDPNQVGSRVEEEVKAQVRTSLWASLLYILVSTGGCGILGLDTERFIIEVGEIQGPDSIGPEDTLVLRFIGGVGPDQCSRVERIEVVRSRDLAELTFHGERSGGTCLTQPRRLDHSQKFQPPFGDVFLVRVRQPGGGILEKSVVTR
ncbi:MAG: hypothetical protein AMXMBFR53_15450 [Gemmatimonadota bacterium]